MLGLGVPFAKFLQISPFSSTCTRAREIIHTAIFKKFATMSGESGDSILQQILNEYSSLKSSEIVKIRDYARVENLLSNIVKDGSESLQVITDFDHTVSRLHLNGERCDILHGIFAFSPKLPQDFRDATLALFNKYYPIEISHEMTEMEKLPYMVEWFEKSHELIVGTGVDKEFVKQLVLNSTCKLRDNADQLFQMLHEAKIPVLIFSAGLGDLLEIVLEQNNIHTFSNTKIISNYMEFDKTTGKIIAFKPPLIHTLNKNESSLFKGDNYFMDLAHRHNALVIGDNIGDSLMGTGMKNPNAVLKIGFLNEKIEQRLDSFLEVFDVALCDDQSMDFVNLILKQVIKKY